MASLIAHVARLAASESLGELDTALAQALLELHAPAGVAVHVPVGEAADLRWFTRLQLAPGAAPVLAEVLWADVGTLPPLDADPARLDCITRCVAVHSPPDGDTPHQSVLPLRSAQQTVAVVVLTAPQAGTSTIVQDFERLQRAWQHRQAALDAGSRDSLTGLPNRKAFASDFASAARGGPPAPAPPEPAAPGVERRRAAAGHYWLGLVNIDGFAHINARLGHLAGDAVLAQTGQRLVGLLRFYDRVFRLAGSEFVVLLRCPDGGAASSAFERVRGALADAAGAAVPLALCVGYTAVQPGDSPGAALERADRALFAAKSGGSLRVRSDVGLPEPAPAGGPAGPPPPGVPGMAPGGGWLQ